MRSAKEIQKEIDTIIKDVKVLEKSKDKKDKAMAKKMRNMIPQLTQFLHYVETEPRGVL